MSIWDNLTPDGELAKYEDLHQIPSTKTPGRDMSVNVSEIHQLNSGLNALRQQVMAMEDNITAMVKATSSNTSENARYQDVFNVEKKLTEFKDANEETQKGILDRLDKQQEFLNQVMNSSEEAQRNLLAKLGDKSSAVNAIPVNTDPESLENSMFADLDPAIAEMAKRAGIGFEDLHDLALKVAEVKKADEVAKLQLAHVEKVNEQVKEISLKKMEIEQHDRVMQLDRELREKEQDKEIRLAEINAELDSDKQTVEADRDVRNHRDIELSKARWAALNAVSEHWSNTVTTLARWGSVGGGVAFLGYCLTQVAKAYFAQ